MSDKGTCRSCGAAIIWARTEAGKPMPLDADPVSDAATGTFILTGIRNCQAALSADPGPYYMNHFATCPQGASWSKGQRT